MSNSEPELIYVYLPESLGPIDRGDKYEDPIIDELERSGLGEVSGGGSSLGEPRPDGTRLIESCGIDIDTHDSTAARELLRELLPKLGCPKGTRLQYTQSDRPLQDEFDGTGWALEREAAPPDPGLGISFTRR